MKPSRTAWGEFPDVQIHAGETTVKKHPSYHAAKLGDADAAEKLVSETINNDQVEALRKLAEGHDPILVSVHAYEKGGVNAIPEAFADELANRLRLRTDTNIVQTNAVEHTGADGYIESRGGKVIGAVSLTGKTYSAKLTLDKTQLDELRAKHGTDLENWWKGKFGHSFDLLTQSEARYLARSKDADTIRDRIAAAEQAGDSGETP